MSITAHVYTLTELRYRLFVSSSFSINVVNMRTFQRENMAFIVLTVPNVTCSKFIAV